MTRGDTRSHPRALRFGAAALAVACLAPAGAGGAEGRSAATEADGHLPGAAIVRFEPGVSAAERREARRGADVRFGDSLGLPRAELVEVEGSVAAAVRRLERQPGVAYAQPNFRYEAVAVEPPNDTFFGELWGLSDPELPDPGVSALEAWEESKGAGQVIAILDTGVDLTHPDLEGNLWANPSPDPIAEDLHGFDFVDDDGDPDDYQFHGTHVAGTAAAISGNEKGIAGVAPEAEIMAVRVLDGDGVGFTSEIAEGIEYAAENGADVINMSLGGPGPGDELMSDAVSLAAEEDVVVVAAAGNQGSNNDVAPTTPCTLPQANLICVAALNRNGGLSSFSNYGANTVDLAAPGGGDVIGGGILSAKTDYGPDPPLFSENFTTGFGSTWKTAATAGGIKWDTASLSGNQLATDSVGQDYESDRISALFTTDAFNLTGERGCRVHFRTMYEIEEFFDAFEAGAFSEAEGLALQEFDGTSSGYPNSLTQEQVSISILDDLSDVRPLFRINADELEELDGAYVDDVRLICRDETYVDEIASGTFAHPSSSGNYVRFNGTSMAAPHVAGIAALVRAATDPEATATEIVDAILTGASAIPQDDLGRPTATHGIADACQAIAVATGGDFEAECPGSSENVVPPSVTEVEEAIEAANPPVTVGPSTPPPSPALRTFFRHRPPKLVRTRQRLARVVFRFGSNESDATFVCRIDGGLFRPCRARVVRRFKPGWHAIRVVARAADGRADLTPAVYRFRVKLVGQVLTAHLRKGRLNRG